MEFPVWTYFSQFDFVGSSIYIMEVAKVKKLSLEDFESTIFLLILGDSKVEKKVHHEREPCGTQWGSKERKWADKAVSCWRGR